MSKEYTQMTFEVEREMIEWRDKYYQLVEDIQNASSEACVNDIKERINNE